MGNIGAQTAHEIAAKFLSVGHRGPSALTKAPSVTMALIGGPPAGDPTKNGSRPKPSPANKKVPKAPAPGGNLVPCFKLLSKVPMVNIQGLSKDLSSGK
jgi:hypothetical protein